MENLFDRIAVIADNSDAPIILCARDCRGMPVVTPVSRAFVRNASLVFALPTGTPVASALTAHPETAVSILAPTGDEGYQLKGKTAFLEADEACRKELNPGAKEVACRLAIQEVYGIVGAVDQDLNLPLWECDCAWSEDRFRQPVGFEMPDHPEERLPPELVAELRKIDAQIKKAGLAAWLGTINDYGVPNISPRMLVEIESDHWLFGDCDDHKSARNMKHTCASSIALIDWSQRSGYIASGWVELGYHPESMHKVRDYWDSIGFDAPVLHADNFYFGELNEFSGSSWKQLFVDDVTLRKYSGQ